MTLPERTSDGEPVHFGGCLCGGVRYRVGGALRDAIACHCTQCRRTSGHHAAMTSAASEDLTLISSRTLEWYRSSPAAERGFCRVCGSNLFWRPEGKTGRQSPPEPSIRPPASSSRSISSSATRATTTRSTTVFHTRPAGSLEPEDVKPARAVPCRAGAPCPPRRPRYGKPRAVHVAAQRRSFARPAASFNSVQHVASRLVPQSLG